MTKSTFEENKGKGNTFGGSREKSPDRSYFIPQLQKVPGPGQVFLYLCSIIMKKILKIILALP